MTILNILLQDKTATKFIADKTQSIHAAQSKTQTCRGNDPLIVKVIRLKFIILLLSTRYYYGVNRKWVIRFLASRVRAQLGAIRLYQQRIRFAWVRVASHTGWFLTFVNIQVFPPPYLIRQFEHMHNQQLINNQPLSKHLNTIFGISCLCKL